MLDSKLIVVTGKGGTGKSTLACALGLIAARRGQRTIVAELGEQHRLPGLFRVPDTPTSGEEVELEPGLWSTSIDPDKALIEWLRTLGGRISVRMLAGSNTFRYFAAAAPGAKELLSMVKVRELCEGSREQNGVAHAAGAGMARDRSDPSPIAPYDLVVLDASATGHALAMLRSPRTFGAIVRAGPLAEQTQSVRRLLEDPRRSSYVAVAQGTEMAVTETLELEEGLRRQLDRDLDVVVVNGTVPRRFTREELELIAKLDDSADVVRGAAHMAHVVHERARLQQSQIARLRRQRFARGLPPNVLTLPMLFTPEIGLADVRGMSVKLERKL
ncbi:MAG TPA: ArsA-related P-loop ATPase [Solirubrobacteraceae bacterium]|nr:ArsA-related P-loop ATPase [Solirubrobacteraceae bacterium]